MSVLTNAFSPFEQTPSSKTIINTYIGADGTVGLVGPVGDTGSVGPQGLKGATGDAGAQGVQGIPGARGKDGTDTSDYDTMTAGPIIPDINWVPKDLNISGTLSLGPNATKITGTPDGFIDVPDLSINLQRRPASQKYVYGGFTKFQPSGGTGTGQVVSKTVGLYRSTSGGFGRTGEAIQWPHGLRARRQANVPTYDRYIGSSPRYWEEFYVPSCTPVLDTNQYQFIMNITGIDDTNIYANVCKVNNGTSNNLSGNSYSGYYNIAWTCALINTNPSAFDGGRSPYQVSY